MRNVTELIKSPLRARSATLQLLITQGTFVNFMACLLSELRAFCLQRQETELKQLLPYLDPFLEQMKIKQLSGQKLHVLENMLKAFILCLRARRVYPSRADN